MEKLPYSVAVFVRTKISTALVQDPEQRDPLYWKPPGGHGDPGESPVKTAVREVFEEIGLRIVPKMLRYVGCETRENHNGKRHYYYLYEVYLANFHGIKPIGETGERVRIYPLNKLRQMPDLLWNARRLLTKYQLI